MTQRVNRSLVLAARPVGVPKESDYRIEESALPELGEGQFLVRNVYMSVDPYMRGMMRGVEIGASPTGGAVGQVIESCHDLFGLGLVADEHPPRLAVPQLVLDLFGRQRGVHGDIGGGGTEGDHWASIGCGCGHISNCVA